MTDPDVEHAGWATGGAGSRLRRRRNPLLLLVAVVLLGGGAAATVVGIVRLATEAGPSEDRIVARGTVAALGAADAQVVLVESDAEDDVTLWLRAGGASNVRDRIVGGTACAVVRPDGSSSRVRGSRQGASVAVDRYATIGPARVGRGVNAVTCRHVPFGRRFARGRLRQERPFVVERGTPGDGLRGMWLLFPGIGATLLGVPAALRWRRGSLREV